MRRYVRRGSTGIALIDNSGGKPFLRYVFDVADTGGEDETRPQLWKYREEHRKTVSAALERRFDMPIGDGSLPEQLEKISVQFMADYWREHQQDIPGAMRPSTGTPLRTRFAMTNAMPPCLPRKRPRPRSSPHSL